MINPTIIYITRAIEALLGMYYLASKYLADTSKVYLIRCYIYDGSVWTDDVIEFHSDEYQTAYEKAVAYAEVLSDRHEITELTIDEAAALVKKLEQS